MTAPFNPAASDPTVETWPSGLLQQLMHLLAPQPQGGCEAAADPDQLDTALQQLARWRLACGDLPGAARWQRLARPPYQLIPLRQELCRLLQHLGQTPLAERLRPPPPCANGSDHDAWGAVQRALLRGRYRSASQQQATLLARGSAMPPHHQVGLLVLAWLQAGQQQPARQLLTVPNHAPWLEPHQIDDAPTAAAIGWLLRPSHPTLASLWWQRSLEINPQQPALSAELSAGQNRGCANPAAMQIMHKFCPAPMGNS
ncbi:MAG: hypothetical protein ACNA8O_03525 [Cyanobacteriota bacterium]|jgi:hypothetical protein